MSTTLQIISGDVVMSKITGRPIMIGNPIIDGVVTTNPAQARSKFTQDISRSLSLGTVRAGTTANIQSIIGTVPQFGAAAISLMVNRQIRDMVAAIIRTQSLRPNIRPASEKLRGISKLQVYQIKGDDKTKFGFVIGLRTQDERVLDITGQVG